MKFSFYTLGCKVNQFETESLKDMVLDKGYTLCDQSPDILIINTCTVTAVSDKKNIKLIKKVKKENPNAIVAVCGCFAQISPEKAGELDGVDIVCGTDKRSSVIDMCIESFNTHKKFIVTNDTANNTEFEVLPVSKHQSRTRPLLKIQDGCNNFCSYCIIPYARGRSRSMPFETVISQTHELCELGAKEIIITGIEISSYGKDIGTNLISLLEKLLSEFPSIRFRLGSLEPRTITEEFCQKLSQFENLCPHFHLSLQSGSDSVLSRMNRKYDTTLFYNVCSLLRTYFANPSITTDLIVGFPGETEDEFSESVEFIKKCKLSSVHVFPYSIREGTRASSMEDQIDINIKNQRAKIASDIAQDLEIEFLQSFLGQKLSVILETNQTGHSKYHFPIKCECDDFSKGQIRNVEIVNISSLNLIAK